MSQRERTLAMLVGGVLVLLVNVVLINFFLKNHTEQRDNIAAAQGKIDGLKRQESQRALWAERDQWLTANMPVIGDPQVESRELSSIIKDAAQKHQVTIETPSPGVPNRQPLYTALNYKISAKANWKAMGEFLYELQKPGRFLVLDPVEIKVDATDKSQLRAEVTVSKWFAP